MPVYTARVVILNDKHVDDEIWFQNIRAGSSEKANAIAKEQATRYIDTVNDAGDMDSNLAYGFDILFCMRTALVDNEEKKAKAAGHINTLTVKEKDDSAKAFVDKHVKKRVRMKVSNKFAGEMKGDFNDPFSFAEGVIHRVK